MEDDDNPKGIARLLNEASRRRLQNKRLRQHVDEGELWEALGALSVSDPPQRRDVIAILKAFADHANRRLDRLAPEVDGIQIEHVHPVTHALRYVISAFEELDRGHSGALFDYSPIGGRYTTAHVKAEARGAVAFVEAVRAEKSMSIDAAVDEVVKIYTKERRKIDGKPLTRAQLKGWVKRRMPGTKR